MNVLGHLAAASRDVGQGLLDLLLPGLCAGCGRAQVAAGALCDDCRIRLAPLITMPYCPRCGTSVAPGAPVRPDGCGGCPTVLPRFERVIRLGPYRPPLRQIVRQFKYRRSSAMLRYLSSQLIPAIQTASGSEMPDLVLPVPTHWRRRFSRSYDHSRALAGRIAAGLGVPLGHELIRIRHTPMQAHLGRTRRMENVRGAFEVSRPKPIAGARILLVDDVTTTGATANEAARTLLAAGAEHVILAVIAKADPPRAYAESSV